MNYLKRLELLKKSPYLAKKLVNISDDKKIHRYLLKLKDQCVVPTKREKLKFDIKDIELDLFDKA